jgi:UDP-galactopyranose mutase
VVVPPDLICFSHLRWDFVFQRPHHLMVRAARDRRVLFIEEPVSDARASIGRTHRQGVTVLTPRLPDRYGRTDAMHALQDMVRGEMRRAGVTDPVRWYWTPMQLRWSDDLPAAAIVYDCMDELSAFRGAPPELVAAELDLLRRADLVFTGGTQLFRSKRGRHHAVHRFPSSVDHAHFAQARSMRVEPADQASIPAPRLGWFGVIDERFDGGLVAAVAAMRPDWQLVLVGPTAKVDPAELPSAPNIHYLGPKDYRELPAYLARWDVGIMPFAMNDATRFISPTKTPEYLAAGLPVVSTPIADVVEPYGTQGLVGIAGDAPSFIEAVERALVTDRRDLMDRADRFLANDTWDATWQAMDRLIREAVAARVIRIPTAPGRPVPPLDRVPAVVAAAGGAPAVQEV